ncbi:hypothetical protein DPMN_148649 [Dreissena polymorpha]|uniref:Uncharacterized protein n=1 Tax=Dreissena polymorpha TaxID=45954 RepID=A0A9D4FCA1_DREPO|nr:hypothetical protein DPMN_148649 [Dreissena polymorpha]
MPVAVQRVLKVDEVVEEVKLLLRVFLNENFEVNDLFHCAQSCSKSNLLFRQQFLGLTFQSVEYDAQLLFNELADYNDGVVIRARLGKPETG